MRGRKRHILVDTQGSLLAATVTPADVPDVDGAYALLPAAKVVAPTLATVWVDGGYAGDWADWAAEEHGVAVAVVRRPPGTRGFAVQPRRWVVERTFAWLSRHRRLSRDYERYATTSATLLFLASCHLLVKRLHPALNN